MYLTFLAILIITVIGIAVGIYMTRNMVIAGFIMGTVNIIYTIPSIALFGFLVAVRVNVFARELLFFGLTFVFN